MRAEYERRGVGFLALSLEPDVAKVRAAIEAYPIAMTVATTEDETLGPFGVKDIPSTVFIDEDGVIVAAVSGTASRAFFEARVRALTEK